MQYCTHMGNNVTGDEGPDCYDKREIYLASFTERDLKAGKIVDKGSFLRRLAIKGGVQ